VLELFAWSEHHALLWETAALKRLGGALSRLAATEALSAVAAQTLKHTFFASLMAAVALPAYIIKVCANGFGSPLGCIPTQRRLYIYNICMYIYIYIYAFSSDSRPQ